MRDLISRQAAIDALGERPVVWDEWTDEYTLGQRKQYDYDKLAIEALPSAEVEPVKHGRWYRPEGWPKKTYKRKCTHCQGVAYFCGSGDYLRCPNCGAQMKGEE